MPRAAAIVPPPPAQAYTSSNMSIHVLPTRQSGTQGTADDVAGEVWRALAQTLSQSGLFSAVDPDGASDYDLASMILLYNDPGTPLGGITMTGKVAIEYILTTTRAGDEVWRTTISTENAEGFFSSLSGATRKRKAKEGALRENLAQLVDQLAQAVGAS